MNKKIIASILVIVMAMAAMAGGSLAFFTDADSTPTNTFVAGTLSMDVDDVFDYEDNTYDDFTPGDMIPKLIQVTNNGTKREFLRAFITEERTQVIHFIGTDLVEYLPALNTDGTSKGMPGKFLVVDGVLQYDSNGRPIEDDTNGMYVTNLGAYSELPANYINGELGTTPVEIEFTPVVKLSNTSDPASSPVPVEGFGVYLTLPEANWLVTTTHARDMDQVAWEIADGSPWSNGNWSQLADGYWYFKQALYPEGYDETPADGNDDATFAATIAPFLYEVQFTPGDNDNIYQGSIYTIDVTFETIQVTNDAAETAWLAAFSHDLDLDTKLAADLEGTWSEVVPTP